MKPILLWICAGAVLAGDCIQVPDTRQGRVEVIATALTGAPIADIDVQFVPLRGGRPIKAESRVAQIPYGDYQVHAVARGFAPAHREIRLYQADTIVRVDLEVGSIGCPDPPAEIGGRVRQANTGKELWIKAIPVRGIGGGEARVSKEGHFLISGLEYTSYLVIVMEGESVLRHQVVKTYPIGSNPRLEIDLSTK